MILSPTWYNQRLPNQASLGSGEDEHVLYVQMKEASWRTTTVVSW